MKENQHGTRARCHVKNGYMAICAWKPCLPQPPPRDFPTVMWKPYPTEMECKPQVRFIYLFFYIVLVLPYIKMNLPQVYMCFPSWTLFPPPSPYHPSGSSQMLEVDYFTILYWFCHTPTWIHHGCTRVPNPEPPSHLPPPYHPSGSSQCTSPKLPVSCIKPGLAIRFLYDIIHVSMPFSQIILLPPSPTESKRLF